MKGKIAKILGVGLALALVLSLTLVPAVADTPADTDVGFLLGIGGSSDTAEWVDIEAESDTEGLPELVSTLPTGGLGDYSVKLVGEAGAPPYIETSIEFVPVPGTTLADLASASDWSYWYYHAPWVASSGGPNLKLRFTMPVGYDPTSDTGHVDLYVQAGACGADNPSGELVPNVWHEEDVIVNDTVLYRGNDPDDGTYFQFRPADPDWSRETLADVLALINEEDAMGSDTADDWELTRVRMEVLTERTFYIDDITIDGTTYELEPIFLDAEYYSVGDTVEVTVPNFAANTDPNRINPVAAQIEDPLEKDNWTVSVTSDSDEVGIIVALEETGADTGVFTASFGTSDTSPIAEDELYIEDGDEITVTYTPSDPWWGDPAGAVATTLTADVDDTPPTISGLTPEDDEMIEETKPEISADYDDDTADIDEDSVEMFLDGEDVTDDASSLTTSAVVYTPDDDLDEGSHDVTVNVSDNAGNEATETWSFRIVSWLEDQECVTGDELNALDTVGVAVFITGGTGGDICVGRYASNPEPDAALTFTTIEDGFFDAQVTGADDATQIIIKFADSEITAESTAYVWDDLEGKWLACDDQGYNPTDEFLWVKVREADTTPNISELSGTPFAISTEVPCVDILDYYRGLGEDPNVVETTDLLQAGNDWANEVVPSGFTEPISTTQLLALANEWAATD